MKKKADWKQNFLKFLQNNRQAVGVGLAGLGGGLVGGGLLPGLIYKKPTLTNRFILGGGTGLLTALGVMAALSKGKQIPSTAASAAEQGLSGIKQLPSTLLGGMPTAKQFQGMGSVQRALYGKEGTGLPGWAIRNIKRALPNYSDIFGKSQTDKAREDAGLSFKTSDKTYLSRALLNLAAGGAAAGATQWGLHNMAKNYHRSKQIGDLIAKLKGTDLARLDARTVARLNLLKNHAARSGVGSFWQLLKATPTVLRDKLAGSKLGQKLHIAPPNWISAHNARMQYAYNPFLQRAAISSGGKTTNQLFKDLADATETNPSLSALSSALGRNSKHFRMPPARGLSRLGRLGRRSLPVFAALLAGKMVNGLTGANKDYNAMVSQPLYKDL